MDIIRAKCVLLGCHAESNHVSSLNFGSALQFDCLIDRNLQSLLLVLAGQIAQEFSECSSGKKGGDLGWFPRGKMAGPFQDVAFATPIGVTSAPFKST